MIINNARLISETRFIKGFLYLYATSFDEILIGKYTQFNTSLQASEAYGSKV
jgi:hypothetical protein